MSNLILSEVKYFGKFPGLKDADDIYLDPTRLLALLNRLCLSNIISIHFEDSPYNLLYVNFTVNPKPIIEIHIKYIQNTYDSHLCALAFLQEWNWRFTNFEEKINLLSMKYFNKLYSPVQISIFSDTVQIQNYGTVYNGKFIGIMKTYGTLRYIFKCISKNKKCDTQAIIEGKLLPEQNATPVQETILFTKDRINL